MNSDHESWRNSGPVYTDFAERFPAMLIEPRKLRTSRRSLACRMEARLHRRNDEIAPSPAMPDTGRQRGRYPSKRFIKQMFTVLRNVCYLYSLICNSKKSNICQCQNKMCTM